MTSTATSRPCPGALRWDPGDHARVVYDSWRDAGWRSVLLRRLDNERDVECADLPALDDQVLVLVTQGHATLEARTDGGRWRRCDYAPGRIGMTAPGRAVTLRWRTISPERMQTLHLYLPGRAMVDCAAQLWGRDIGTDDLPDTLGTNDRLIETTMLAMSDAASTGADDLYAESAAAFLTVHLLSQYGDVPRTGRLAPLDHRVRQAIEFMHDNLALPLTLCEIAQAAGLSTFHFVRLFSAAMGQPPRHYLTGLRVEAACHLLEHGGHSVTEVAYLCGFSSSAHLGTALRRHLGMSPTAYRRDRTPSRAVGP
jgi:AraC family transcriptional regulator